MIDEKQVEEVKYRFKQYLQEKLVSKTTPNEFTVFFLNNSGDSLETAQVLFKISTETSLQQSLNLSNFNGLLWVINSTYYSMFYLVRALLETKGVRLRTSQSIHSLTFDALVYYFYANGTFEKKLVEQFKEAQEEASEILGREKARDLIEKYSFEKEKRGRFTYEMGQVVLRSKAQTSLERAISFNTEIKRLFF